MVNILAQIARSMNVSDSNGVISGHINGNNVPTVPFKPTRLSSRVNTLWFTALGLSITSSMMTMLAKQWLYEYSVEMTGTSSRGSRHRLEAQAQLRQYRYEGMVNWHVTEIIACLPLMLHLSVLLFAVGLILLLWHLDHNSAAVITLLSAMTFVAYMITTILPSFFTECPYKTPLSHFISNAGRIIAWITRKLAYKFRPNGKENDADIKLTGVLLEKEKKEVEQHKDQLSRKSLRWLKENTPELDYRRGGGPGIEQPSFDATRSNKRRCALMCSSFRYDYSMMFVM